MSSNLKYLNKDEDFYGPEYERYIVSCSFSGKDKDEIGVIKVIGKYFTDTDSDILKFERPMKDGGSHIYNAYEIYEDLDIAKRQYLLTALSCVNDYQNKISILLSNILSGIK